MVVPVMIIRLVDFDHNLGQPCDEYTFGRILSLLLVTYVKKNLDNGSCLTMSPARVEVQHLRTRFSTCSENQVIGNQRS